MIFSINYDEISRTIISTSDDRTVRTWSLRHEDEEPNHSNLWSLFGRAKIDSKYELYGHEARVWKSVIIRQNQCDSGLIASLGEDSRICLWDLMSGKLVSKFDAHPGTSVWAAVWDSRLQLLVGYLVYFDCQIRYVSLNVFMNLFISGNCRRRRFNAHLERQSFTGNELSSAEASRRQSSSSFSDRYIHGLLPLLGLQSTRHHLWMEWSHPKLGVTLSRRETRQWQRLGFRRSDDYIWNADWRCVRVHFRPVVFGAAGNPSVRKIENLQRTFGRIAATVYGLSR